MNKKIFVMLCVCLLGAISMTSCIDNKESESVTNIREAKAEQLKALAALSDAQAQAAKILAQAQATQAQAEALLAQANAELIATQAEEQRLRNELIALQIAYEKALQYAKEEAELAKYRAEIAEAEARVAQAQAALAEAELRKANVEEQIKLNEYYYKTQLLQAKLEYEKAQAEFDITIKNIKEEAARAELYRLSDNYRSAMNNLYTAQANLANTKMSLISYKGGIITDSLAYQSSIISYQNDIDNYNKEITYAKNRIEIIKKVTPTSSNELKEKVLAAEDEKINAQKRYDQAGEDYNNAITTADKNYNNNVKFDIYTYLRGNKTYQLWENCNGSHTSYTANGVQHSINSQLCYYLRTAEIYVQHEYYVLYASYNSHNVNAKLYYDPNRQGEKLSLGYTSPSYNADVLESIYNDEKASLTAQKESAATEEEKAQFEDQLATLEILYSVFPNLPRKINEFSARMTKYNNDVVSCYTDAANKWKAIYDAEYAIEEANSNYYALSNQLYNAEQNENEIKSLEQQIRNYESYINNANVQIERLKVSLGTNTSEAEMIAAYEVRIKLYENEVAFWSAQAKEAKEKLDAATKGEPAPAPTPDPTPEQGNDSGTSDEGTDSDNSSDDEAE